MCILIVDDREENRDLLQVTLETAGFDRVAQASSATDALRQLSQDGAADFDLILMDIMMPDIDGVEACRRIRASEALAKIPIIMVTAKGTPEVLEEAFAAGAIDFLTKPYDPIELVARVSSALALKRERDCCRQREHELMALSQALAEANGQLELLARRDALTGVANRRAFDEQLEVEWRRAARDRHSLSVVILDVDHFKAYNDTYGHPAGDRALTRVANSISSTLRRPGDLAARYGGEEFVLLLPQTEYAGAQAVAERVRSTIEALEMTHAGVDDRAMLTVSLGVSSVVPDGSMSAEWLTGAADASLYRAKQAGRNRVGGTGVSKALGAIVGSGADTLRMWAASQNGGVGE